MVAIPGVDTGRIMRKRIIMSFAPSILADSAREAGTPLKKLRIKRQLYALTMLGSIRTQMLFFKCRIFVIIR